MPDSRRALIQKAIEFVEVRDELLDTLEQAPSEARDSRAAQLASRKDQLLHAVMKVEGAGPSPSQITG